jgi:hypothetical protein
MRLKRATINYFILKSILVFLFLFLLPGFFTSTFAQIYQKGDINIGFEGGVQFTTISDSYTINIPTAGVGFSLGPYAEYHVSNAFKLRFGLTYDNRKFGLNEPPYAIYDTAGVQLDSSYFQFNRDYSVNYLTIPLSVIYVKGSEKFKAYVQLSFYYSLYLNAHHKGKNDLFIHPLDYQNISDTSFSVGHNIKEFDETVDELFNSSDFGINFYLGLIFKLAPNLGLTVTPGFTIGMGNVYENPARRSKWTRIFKINTGIVYTLKKKKKC